ncbi:lysophospholipid acyltransferase family protein [sulfur-oxidizing endosymbiont of Gigantopelta aegis]|uniref:lysophospholipid acyltransferase family protein n=1 Tax=sulfur-oxidizing endosymbiont of Gigantopelta aegis TaxID=2794934 RepID=UPI0018DE5516|nr:lysophospholipid acyltransferase family protein [sulfur-oxidizing endosymbiont of Gigantopelta aegis]
MFLIIKKSYRFLRIILHVHWGIVQVLYYLDDKKSPSATQKIIIQRWFKRFVRLLSIEIKIHGEVEENSPLMVSNHISWKDIILLGSVYPTRFVAKSEIAQWPVVGWMSAKVGTIFVKRGSIADIRQLNTQIADLICAGERVTIFPEGGTSDGRQLAHFFPGLLQSVVGLHGENIRPGVQPIVISYKVADQLSEQIPFIGDANMLQHLWALLGLDKITADLHFTPFISSENTTRKALSTQSVQQMQEILKNKV